MRGHLFVISAPSGGGKTSLVNAMLARNKKMSVSVSHTTRPKRPGEVDGLNYYFVTTQVFSEMKQEASFLEDAEVFGNWYGTSKQWVSQKLSEGMDVVLEIDWQGAQQIRQQMQTTSIFILPPSRKTLYERLHGRGQDDESVIEQRMKKAEAEIAHFIEYDYLVVNDDFNKALFDLECIVRAHQLQNPTRLKEVELLTASLLCSL